MIDAVWQSALFAVFLWWFGTGAVLLLGRVGRLTATVIVFGALVASLWTMAGTAQALTVWSALWAFTAGVGLWGVHEAAFLAGFLTGPRRAPCPPGARGWLRFRLATATLIHHEIALALTAAALAVWLWDAPNAVALWTFLALWAMRLSVKFNIFLGAPNVADEFLPKDLRYLASYFSPRPMNALFPFSVTIGTVAAGGLLLHACAVAATPFEAAGLAVVGALVALGTLEHWFLVLPVRDAALWRWWTQSPPVEEDDWRAGAESQGRVPARDKQGARSGMDATGLAPRVLEVKA